MSRLGYQVSISLSSIHLLLFLLVALSSITVPSVAFHLLLSNITSLPLKQNACHYFSLNTKFFPNAII